ncbi:hypothetical protein Syun_030049 [Stephania yunnanensis]|uniref:Uncharacterized protein n=1 Tax=Stephania yunnanensis TaxID=152371 RepID=A0AAP0E6J7_9MAGN
MELMMKRWLACAALLTLLLANGVAPLNLDARVDADGELRAKAPPRKMEILVVLEGSLLAGDFTSTDQLGQDDRYADDMAWPGNVFGDVKVPDLPQNLGLSQYIYKSEEKESQQATQPPHYEIYKGKNLL